MKERIISNVSGMFHEDASKEKWQPGCLAAEALARTMLDT